MNQKLGITLGIMLWIPLVIWMVIAIYLSISFSIKVTDRLKRAADANTIELATQELTAVINHLEREKLTNGYTSVFYNTPDEDVSFWYQNLKASLEELKKVTDSTTQLERSNILMKLRETILDQGPSTTVTEPMGISKYPSNALYAWFGYISFALVISGIVLIFSASRRW